MDYKLIQYQILSTNIIRIVWQTVRRITNKILGVKELSFQDRIYIKKITIQQVFSDAKNIFGLSLVGLVGTR